MLPLFSYLFTPPVDPALNVPGMGPSRKLQGAASRQDRRGCAADPFERSALNNCSSYFLIRLNKADCLYTTSST